MFIAKFLLLEKNLLKLVSEVLSHILNFIYIFTSPGLIHLFLQFFKHKNDRFSLNMVDAMKSNSFTVAENTQAGQSSPIVTFSEASQTMKTPVQSCITAQTAQTAQIAEIAQNQIQKQVQSTDVAGNFSFSSSKIFCPVEDEPIENADEHSTVETEYHSFLPLSETSNSERGRFLPYEDFVTPKEVKFPKYKINK